MIPRGIRNNNPANLRRSADKWIGLSSVQADKSFFQFTNMLYGIRALIVTLHTYVEKYNLHTIDQFINRFAPTNENDTHAYIHTVKAMMANKYLESKYSLADFSKGTDKLFILCCAICKIESKYALTHTLFTQALKETTFYNPSKK